MCQKKSKWIEYNSLIGIQRGDDMREIKKGDIVSRESYNNDIIFSVIKIIKMKQRR